MSEREQILKSSVSTDNPTQLYDLYLGVGKAVLTLLSTTQLYLQASTVESSSKPTSFSFSPERREPIHIDEEIDLEEWKKALLYDKTRVDNLVQKILLDFNIEPSVSNIQWFYRQIEDMLSDYQRQSDIQLPDETRSMLRNLMIRMSYDKLCTKLPR